MSYVITVPEMIASAATDLATIGSDLSAAHTAAAARTTGILAAAQDEVSTAIAALFSAHGQGFHALSAPAAAFHDQFVRALTAGARSYASAEAANASPLAGLEVFSPWQLLTGRPLVGNGADGAPGTGANGAPGGWLIGNGGGGRVQLARRHRWERWGRRAVRQGRPWRLRRERRERRRRRHHLWEWRRRR